MSVNPIQELRALQEAAGYLRDTDLRALSDRLKIPLYHLEGIASFYPHFRREMPRPLRIGACRDLSCHLRDGGRSSTELKTLCAERDDVEFEEISCPGLCERAPAFLVNDRPATPAEAAAALGAPSTLPDEFPSAPSRWQSVLQSRDFDAVIARVAASGIRGMGGAGFPTGRKWELVRQETAQPKYVVCNADESEPGAFKDRVILEELPHLVIEGTVIAALTVGAERGWIYIRHEYERAREVLESAIAAAYTNGILGESVCGSGLRFDLEIFVSPGGYVLGEETALLEALEGRRGEPRNKPPFPGVEGYAGKPTLMNNVETLAQIPRILLTGRAELKFFSVSGDVTHPGVVEAPLGTSLRELIERCGGMREGKLLQAFLPGGASTAFLPAGRADIAMDWEPLRDAGTALGAGAVVIVGEDADLFDLGLNLTAFFRNESCGKCVPCRIGTEKAVLLIEQRTQAGLDLLPALNEALLETSLCGLGQVALTPILSILEHFPPPRAPEEKV
jgi:NADH:ubiquinone oxidoreductase subunit F (NADH-binding)/NADH:ubiquinone oxidoreductase subunit E